MTKSGIRHPQRPMGASGISFSIWLATLGFTTSLYAFPEMVRYGYANCSSCHVSPSGGGVTTEYGKRISEDVLSTWAREGESNFLHNAVPTPSWLAIGGDVRELRYRTQQGSATLDRTFLMQADGELAYVSPTLAVDGSWGMYDGNHEFRRHYIKYMPTPNWSLRVGKFMPAYGIMTPEHELSTRRGSGFNQGTETYNAEIGFLHEKGEIIYTQITKYDSRDNLHEAAGSLRVAAYVHQRSQVGWSFYAGLTPDTARHHILSGPFVILGITPRLYYMLDTSLQKYYSNWREFMYKYPGLVLYNRLGYEFYKGMHVSLVGDFQSQQLGKPNMESTTFGPAFHFYPRPHFEISATWMKQQIRAISTSWQDMGNLMLHYYF